MYLDLADMFVYMMGRKGPFTVDVKAIDHNPKLKNTMSVGDWDKLKQEVYLQLVSQIVMSPKWKWCI